MRRSLHTDRDGSKLVGAGIDASIVIGDREIETLNRIVNSLIDRSTAIRFANNRLPSGHQIIVGEGSTLILGGFAPTPRCLLIIPR